MKKLFFFKNVSAQHVKVSHGAFVGLPSITGLTGLNRLFAIELARELGLQPDEIQPAGAMLALEGYHLHEGFKKAHKGKSSTYEAVPAAWASFTAHIALDVRGTTERAVSALSGEDLAPLARDLLSGMSLCKGSLRQVNAPVNLARFRKEGEEERDTALRLLPSASLVVRDYGHLVTALREANVPLMEGLVAATLYHHKRPQQYAPVFEENFATQVALAPVMDGYLKLENTPSGKSMRPTAQGEQGASTVASPTFTLARLQQAASLRLEQTANAEEAALNAFWREHKSDTGYFCRGDE